MQYVSQQITGFTSTNLTDTYNDYSPVTTYTFESGTPTNASIARYGTYYYRSLVNGNVGNTPTEHENIKWLKWEVSNKYAILDLSAQSKSRYTGDMVVEFLQNRMTTLGIGNYEANTVTIEIKDILETVIWSYTTTSALNEFITDYYSYMYEDYGYEVDRAFKVNLPIIGHKVKVTFNKSTEATTTACGFLVGGTPVSIGKTLYGVNFQFTSYAVKEFDDFGTLTITKRAVQDLVDFETVINSNELISMKKEVKKIYNDIVMFIVDENDDSPYENLITLGTIQEMSTVLENPVVTIMSFSIVEAI